MGNIQTVNPTTTTLTGSALRLLSKLSNHKLTTSVANSLLRPPALEAGTTSSHRLHMKTIVTPPSPTRSATLQWQGGGRTLAGLPRSRRLSSHSRLNALVIRCVHSHWRWQDFWRGGAWQRFKTRLPSESPSQIHTTQRAWAEHWQNKDYGLLHCRSHFLLVQWHTVGGCWSL